MPALVSLRGWTSFEYIFRKGIWTSEAASWLSRALVVLVKDVFQLMILWKEDRETPLSEVQVGQGYTLHLTHLAYIRLPPFST